MNVILLEPSEAGANGLVVLADHRARHIRDVLRARTGHTLRVGIINGPLGCAEIESLSGTEVRLRCVFADKAPVRPAVDLLLALPRPKVMGRLWPQLAALGVGRVFLTNAAKVERYYFDSHVLNPEFVRRRLIEGLQQAGDTRLPEFTIHKRLKVFVEDELTGLTPDSARLLAFPGAGPTIPGALAQSSARRVLLAVGPEGGWTAHEYEMLQRHGFYLVAMGARILRTDTACVALLALVHDALQTCRLDARPTPP